ncbi:MAG TPA: flagellar assembly protein FliW [Solirubrobacteraceae bacterium]|nr:flagellar assembly protein FliW [Solirubrobacteraceae bacterium]
MSTVMTTFESTRFGTVELEPEAIVEFPAGLIGLGGTRYAVVATDPDAPFAWLHSLEEPGVALPVTNPWLHFADYAVELSDADTERVGASDDDQPAVWVTVRAASDLSGFSCNLRAPIVIWNGRGHQVINEAPDAPVRAPLFPEAATAPAA